MWSLVVTMCADLLTESTVWCDWMEYWSDHLESTVYRVLCYLYNTVCCVHKIDDKVTTSVCMVDSASIKCSKGSYKLGGRFLSKISLAKEPQQTEVQTKHSH